MYKIERNVLSGWMLTQFNSNSFQTHRWSLWHQLQSFLQWHPWSPLFRQKSVQIRKHQVVLMNDKQNGKMNNYFQNLICLKILPFNNMINFSNWWIWRNQQDDTKQRSTCSQPTLAICLEPLILYSGISISHQCKKAMKTHTRSKGMDTRLQTCQYASHSRWLWCPPSSACGNLNLLEDQIIFKLFTRFFFLLKNKNVDRKHFKEKIY